MTTRRVRSRHYHRAITPTEAVLAEWTRVGEDCRRHMCVAPKIDRRMERKAECLMRNQS